MKRISIAAAASMLTLACGAEPVPQVERVNLALTGDNGVSLNGTTFGGLSLAGAYDTSTSLSGYQFTFPTYQFNPTNSFDPVSGAGPNGPALDGVQLSQLGSIAVDGDVDIADLMGAELEGELVNGDDVLLQIAGVAQGSGANDDLLYYLVFVADGTGWSPLCGTADNGEPIPALAVPGIWDHSQGTSNGGRWKKDRNEFSFACRGSSVSKCVEMGYKPWVDPDSEDGEIEVRKQNRLDRPNHLQACVRMLRADYCGDGTPWTVNGRRVEFWDSMQMHEEDMNWNFEAAWSPDGVECLAMPRVDFSDYSGEMKKGLPKCIERRIRKLERKSECADDSLKDLYKDDDKFLFNSFEAQLGRSSGSNGGTSSDGGSNHQE